MRIAIVNDLPLAVEALRRVVTDSGEHTVAWISQDGAEAVDNCKRDVPDLILMDLFMPVMSGVDAIRQIMQSAPCAILVVTASVSRSTAAVFDALGAGAMDAISMPAIGTGDFKRQAAPLLKKISMLQVLAVGNRIKPPVGANSMVSAVKTATRHPLVVIGASAGGPAAVAEILGGLPSSFQGAIVFVQHVDTRFTDGLVEWLGKQSRIPVRRARNGDRPQPGVMLVAGGDEHLVLESDQTLCYTSEPRELNYRPSIDVFFGSVCEHWGEDLVAVLLTGMGRDGAVGLKRLRKAGSVTIAQDKKSSVVYGMPKAAAVTGAASEIVSLSAIAPRLIELTRDSGKTQ